MPRMAILQPARRAAVVLLCAAIAAACGLALAPGAAGAAYDVTIAAAPTAGGALAGQTFTPNADDAVFDAAAANAALANGGDLLVETGAGGTQDGVLTVDAAIGGPDAGRLALDAATEVRFGPLSTLGLTLDPATAPAVAVRGGLALWDTSSVLAVAPSAGASPAVGAELVVIDNDGSDPVVGTFSNWSADSADWVGDALMRISYAGGDGNDVTLTRERVPSETPLSQSTPRSTLGEAVTLTAVITVDAHAPLPTGTVTFASDGVALGAPVPLRSDATAELTTSALALGTRQLTATYSGDAVTDPSISAPATTHEVVAPVTPPPPPPRPPVERRDPPPPDGGPGPDPGGDTDDGRDDAQDPPRATPKPPRVGERGRAKVVRHGRTLVITTGLQLACPRGGPTCSVSIRLDERRRGSGRRGGGSGRVVTVGRGTARVRAGLTRRLALRTDRRSAPRLASGRRTTVTVVVSARAGTGTPVTTRQVVRLRLRSAPPRLRG